MAGEVFWGKGKVERLGKVETISRYRFVMFFIPSLKTLGAIGTLISSFVLFLIFACFAFVLFYSVTLALVQRYEDALAY